MNQNKSQKKPHHDLALVKRLASQGNPRDHIFTLNKAIKPVVETLGTTDAKARRFILEQISNLNIGDFSDSIFMDNICDIYGKEINKVGWYIKFTVLKDGNLHYIFCISFHPLEKNIKTNSGIIKKF